MRERGDDTLLLADKFVESLNAATQSSKRLSDAARERILGYAFPGNVRELQNELRRAHILSESVLELDELGADAVPMVNRLATPPPVGASLDETERVLILATLGHYAGDKRKAAEVLGISLKTLYNRLNAYSRTP